MNQFTAPLYGLVLAGGESRRMGKDKGLIQYYDFPQREWAAKLLLPFCQQVFISVHDQEVESGFPVLQDDCSYGRIGPIAALHRAMTSHPEAAWMVTACDQPFLTAEIFRKLTEHRNQEHDIICFRTTDPDIINPFPAIYEPVIREKVEHALKASSYSLIEMIRGAKALYLFTENPIELRSIDNFEESEILLQQLRKNKR